ncbi:MAG: ABC transporter permease [Chloroflexi bacterium]|nr:ABC transporter permease [Chloroflexota bacterium]
MKILRYFGVAFESIRANKLRASLTMLGIIIGVAAVMTTMGVGSGAAASITAQIESQGTNLLTINSGGSRGNGPTSNSSGSGATTTLTRADAEVLADKKLHPELALVSPEYSSSTTFVNGDKDSTQQVVGTTPEYALIHNLTVTNGRFFTQEEVDNSSSVIVLGATLASDLFEMTDPVGQMVRVANQPLQVIGVLKASGGSGFGSNDSRAFAPITVAQGRLFSAPRYRGTYTISSISIKGADKNQLDKAQQLIEQTLRLRHGLGADDANDFTIFNQASLLESLNTITTTLTLVLGALGGISLLVGGIGIMNIMLVSVTERTKEIGLRKALGAHDSDILLQFVIEALVLCTLGGLIGIGISYGITFIVKLFTSSFSLIITTTALLLAIGVSSSCGLIFGLYPAMRATRLDPIEALRFE